MSTKWHILILICPVLGGFALAWGSGGATVSVSLIPPAGVDQHLYRYIISYEFHHKIPELFSMV
jgi:hypothetical protein